MKRIVLLLPLLAACSDGGIPIASESRIESRYHLGDLSYIAAGKDLKTDVLGNPFNSDQATFAAVVADHLQGINPGPDIHFTPTPAPTAREPYFVRLAFNGPSASNGTQLCGTAPEVAPSSAPSGAVRVIGAFCRGNQPMTYASARSGGITDMNDPAFRRLVRQVGLLLFPTHNPEDINNCIPPNC
jgi:hypothetical protein